MYFKGALPELSYTILELPVYLKKNVWNRKKALLNKTKKKHMRIEKRLSYTESFIRTY